MVAAMTACFVFFFVFCRPNETRFSWVCSCIWKFFFYYCKYRNCNPVIKWNMTDFSQKWPFYSLLHLTCVTVCPETDLSSDRQDQHTGLLHVQQVYRIVCVLFCPSHWTWFILVGNQVGRLCNCLLTFTAVQTGSAAAVRRFPQCGCLSFKI